jgi:hypothetical protein
VLGSKPTGEASLAVFDGATWMLLPVPLVGHLSGPMVIGPDGTSWFVDNRTNRLYSFDGISWTSDRFDEVLTVEVARDGTIWVAGHYALLRYVPVQP